MRIQKENMLNEKLYMVDECLKEDLYRCRRRLRELDKLITRDEIQAFCKKFFKNFGDSSIVPPFRCDYGYNISIGDRSFINYNTSIIDVAEIIIGDDVLIGPDCGIYTASHPIDPEIRKTGVEFGRKITIENGAWIGGHSTILPGVKIGENSIIGAGSVINKDIPKNVIAAGNPIRIVRKFNENDKNYWQGEYEAFLK